MPYQVIHIVESLEIQSLPTWHINVAMENINIKIDWDITEKSNTNSLFNVFPKAVINAVSTYNVYDPVWNTSFNNKKLCFKVEWKIHKPAHSNYNLNPNSPVFSPSLFTPQRKNTPLSQDSGFHSYNSHPRINSRINNSYQSHSPFPRSNLFKSPSKLSRQDTYVPTQIPTTTPIPSKPKPTIPSSSLNPKPPPDASNTTTVLLPPKTEVPASDPVVDPTPSTPDPQLVPDSHVLPKPTSELIMLPNDPKFVVEQESTDDNIMLIPDPANPNFNPGEDLFERTPNDLVIDPNGLIDPSIKVDCMKFNGKCRLCRESVNSYDVDEHLLVCSKLNSQDVTAFVDKTTNSIGGNHEDVNDQLLGYCQFELDERYTNEVFPSIAAYEKFISNIDQFLNDRATIVFKKCKISGSQSRFNILKFSA